MSSLGQEHQEDHRTLNIHCIPIPDSAKVEENLALKRLQKTQKEGDEVVMKDDVESEKLLQTSSVTIQRRGYTFGESLYLSICSVQFVSMFLLTSQQTFMPLLVREANKQSKFFPTTSVFLMEVIRLITCTLLTTFNLGGPRKFAGEFRRTVWDNKIETAKVCVPAIVYAIQNNLYYVALANIDATTYSVTYQLRILTTAILSVLILSKKLSWQQWVALQISLTGVVLVQLDQSKANSTAAGNPLIGLLAVFSMCWTSAFAGVYFEKMLKKSPVDVWMQNIRLSMLTMPFAVITMLASDYDKIQEGGLLQGWTPLVWTITILNALGGLVVSCVMKYADNVKKTYCQTIAIGSTAVISILLGDSVFSIQLMFGVSMVIASVFIYSFYPPLQKPSIDDEEK